MIETYSETVTEISALGGASHTVSTSMLVCDRCGFKTRKEDLTSQNGYQVCSNCLDSDREDR